LKVESFSDWKKEKKLLSEISEGTINNEKVILAKPQTFMNLSGQSAKSLIKLCRVNKPMGELSRHFWVIHDDIDLPLGKIRISFGRGAAGHKGVESIIRELKTKGFVRFRIGIKPQETKNRKREIERFVLQRFDKEEEKVLKKVIEKTIEAIEMVIKENVEEAMAKYN
jgi:PTH1 family peptidyl-tRNA hydrolase